MSDEKSKFSTSQSSWKRSQMSDEKAANSAIHNHPRGQPMSDEESQMSDDDFAKE